MAAVAPERITWADLRSRAQIARRRAISAGEPGLSMRVTDLVELLPLPYEPEPLPDDATEEEIAEAEREPLDFAEDVLKRHGVRCRPAPGDVGIDGVVVLRASNSYAVQGAIILGVLALIAGAAVSKIAFAGFLPFVLLGVLVTWQRGDWLDRWAPRIVPRGRILGALLMLILVLISAVAVVFPARTWVRERGQRSNALAMAAQTNALLDAGDIDGARATINVALVEDASLGEVQAARDRVLVAEIDRNASLDAAAAAAYQRAEDAFARGDRTEAIDQMTALGAFADAPERVARFRAEAAEIELRAARAALLAGNASRAFERYSDAVALDPTVADRDLVARIAQALSGS